MLGKLIEWSARNVFIVVLATLALIGGGIYAVKKTPLDALPDLSDVQVIVYTPYAGQAPKVVEDQITYPLTTAMLAVPKAKVVRGFSMFGASYVYVIFEDGTDKMCIRDRSAMVDIDAFPGRHFAAKVSYLYPTLNTATRTTPVRLELPNKDGLLRPGMFAHVELATAGNTTRLTVPKSAVIDTGERQIVLRVAGEGKFQPQPVKIGMRGKDAVEILEGLEAVPYTHLWWLPNRSARRYEQCRHPKPSIGRRRRQVRTQGALLPQSDGLARHLADAKKRPDGDGLHRRL